MTFEQALNQLRFNNQGIIPAIAQQHDTGEVLMMAWMNRDAIMETLNQQRVCYWSRSRQQLWRKGESSGHTQQLIEMRIDCDGDALLCLVDQVGPACHTNRNNCFYLSVQNNQLTTIADAVAPAGTDE
ncbi:phosphoribosyl-AMP cyclohydrolase [Candidatus Endobugula sertula]|uniref:Phosphoribosyl-AMP cyclohydrolase n=1 Tax=Candidatus Endobugula sertula TaxID=62101 RepID=A0A1D2QLU8_9GAMM|nr:phosphoribosyl-AMP cyclohydrolase [Candidatus Endobugula sertula]